MSNKNSAGLGLESELEIKFKIGKNNEYDIVAILDLISKDLRGNVAIFDFKSGKYSIRNSTRLQMSIYALAIHKSMKIDSQIELYWYFLRSNKVVHLNKLKKQNLKFENTLIHKVKTIENMKISKYQFEEKASILCNWCKFLTICPTGKKIKY